MIPARPVARSLWIFSFLPAIRLFEQSALHENRHHRLFRLLMHARASRARKASNHRDNAAMMPCYAIFEKEMNRRPQQLINGVLT